MMMLLKIIMSSSLTYFAAFLAARAFFGDVGLLLSCARKSDRRVYTFFPCAERKNASSTLASSLSYKYERIYDWSFSINRIFDRFTSLKREKWNQKQSVGAGASVQIKYLIFSHRLKWKSEVKGKESPDQTVLGFAQRQLRWTSWCSSHQSKEGKVKSKCWCRSFSANQIFDFFTSFKKERWSQRQRKSRSNRAELCAKATTLN